MERRRFWTTTTKMSTSGIFGHLKSTIPFWTSSGLSLVSVAPRKQWVRDKGERWTRRGKKSSVDIQVCKSRVRFWVRGGESWERNHKTSLWHFYFHPQVFVLMQFDPGLEYKPNSRVGAGATNGQGQTNGAATAGRGKDDNSWLLLCSALTDGPYSYI